MSRPELTGAAANFYNDTEARKYDTNSRMIGIQAEITKRALELLQLDTSFPNFILDVGCGSGLSGKVLEEAGHYWVGLDVSRDMLNVASERESSIKGDLAHHDMGTGLPFRSASFDGMISISALQWLCYSNSSKQVPKRRLVRFFSALYGVLKRGARAVLQFYPETPEQAVLISECAAKVGFAGGVVVDYPNSTKAKKHYLVLSFDRGYSTPKGLQSSAQSGVRVDSSTSSKRVKVVKKKGKGKTKEWIEHKKDVQRKKGFENVRKDTKFTGRKRKDKF
ncbi:hypothetical protein TL16_g11289, partial [Triparma laevis f. inornata]|uniref:Uncharacterized protein n=2 Tax=Triparma laevis TaxID=1534972 RepID=A0A9W7FGR4_9STRA